MAARQLGRLASRCVEVNGRALHYRCGAEPLPSGAPVVVLVHGLSISSRYEAPSARRLALSCRVLAPDLPGFGRSADPPTIPGIAALADALAGWLDALGIGRATLVGNSLGANLVFDLAARRPDLVERVVVSGLFVDPRGRSVWTQLKRALRDAPLEPASLLALHVGDFLSAGPRRVLATLRASLRDDLTAKLPRVQAPTLVVRGERDPLAPRWWSKEVAERLPDARYVEVPGAAHTVNYNSPDAFADLILSFLAAELAAPSLAPEPAAPSPPRSEPKRVLV